MKKLGRLGKWGRMRLGFLKEHQPTLLQSLWAMGSLRAHLKSVDQMAAGAMREMVAKGMNALNAEEWIVREMVMPEGSETKPELDEEMSPTLKAFAGIEDSRQEMINDWIEETEGWRRDVYESP